jgi:hypothetical protein
MIVDDVFSNQVDDGKKTIVGPFEMPAHRFYNYFYYNNFNYNNHDHCYFDHDDRYLWTCCAIMQVFSSFLQFLVAAAVVAATVTLTTYCCEELFDRFDDLADIISRRYRGPLSPALCSACGHACSCPCSCTIDASVTTCCICLEGFCRSELQFTCATCRQSVHMSCLVNSMLVGAVRTCPLCRAPLLNPLLG